MALNPFEQALVDEGLVGTPLESLARSIYMQESSGGKNTKTSNAGAVGGMQILPSTFQEVLPGGNINDPYQNSVAGLRYIKKLSGMAGGDPALVAAGYYGGPGGMEKAKQGVAVSDPRNPNAPTTLEYAKQVTERQGKNVSRGTLKPEDVIQDAGQNYQAAYALMSMADEEETDREREAREEKEATAEAESAAAQFAQIQKQLASVKLASPFAAQGSEEVQNFEFGGIVKNAVAQATGNASAEPKEKYLEDMTEEERRDFHYNNPYINAAYLKQRSEQRQAEIDAAARAAEQANRTPIGLMSKRLLANNIRSIFRPSAPEQPNPQAIPTQRIAKVVSGIFSKGKTKQPSLDPNVKRDFNPEYAKEFARRFQVNSQQPVLQSPTLVQTPLYTATGMPLLNNLVPTPAYGAQPKMFNDGGDVNKDAQGSSGGFERWIADKIGLGQAWDTSLAVPKEYGYTGDSGTAGDAMRHMTLMREISKKYGETPARLIGYAHEYIGGPMQYFSSGEPQSSRDREMDIRNNALGLELSKRAKDDQDFIRLAQEAIKNKQADYYREEYRQAEEMPPLMRKARKRAGGSPEEGEVAAEPSLKETAATMLASLKNPEHWKELGAGMKRAATATPGVVESVGRGAIATVPGTPGDIESLIRLGTGGKQVLPTTEDLLKRTDQYRMFSKPEGAEDLEMVGGWISPAGAPASAMIVKGAGKALKPNTAKSMLQDVKGPARMAADEIDPAVLKEIKGAKTGPTLEVRDNRLLPTNERPYVGELERIVSDLPGATTVQQIKGMVAKTGRNYEIERLESALEGLKPNDKVGAADLLKRLDETYSPSTYRIQIIEPDSSRIGKFYQKMDNPRPSESLGVINLLQDSPSARRMESAFYEEKLNQLGSLKSTNTSSAEKEKALKALEVYFRGPDAAGTVMGDTFKTVLPEIRNAVKNMHDANNFYDLFKYLNYGERVSGVPTLTEASYDIARAKYGKSYADLAPYEQQIIRPEAENLIRQKVVEAADKHYGINMQQEFNSPAIQALEPKARQAEMERVFKEQMQMQALMSNREYENLMQPYARLLGEKYQQGASYKGQHPSIAKDNPVAFSRFLDVDLPGGKKGMFIAELQSDRYDDLVTKGAKSGSSAKDMKEISNLHDVLSSRKAQIDELQYLVDKGENIAKNEVKLKQAQIEQARDEQRMSKLGGRVRGSGTYSIEEAFPGMEKNPQVVQQLMIKNAVIGGIQRGKDAVLFPGADSAQKQLYEKLPNNIKAVLKDLGPGFKMETIPMKSENGDIINRVSITWDEKAAQRLQREGVRFAKGGFVEKKY